MFKRIIKNFKTSILGSIAGVPQIISGLSTKNYVEVFTGIATLLMGLAAKDAE